MNVPPPDHARALRRVAWAAAALATGLIVLGGVVRITGSGMGCGDHWPLCDGQWFPPLDLPTLIEIGHRWVAALLSILVAATAWVAWRRHRTEPRLRNPALVALALLVIQVLLGAVTVKLDLPPSVVVVHLANAMLLLAALLVTAWRATHVAGAVAAADGTPGPREARPGPRRVAALLAGLGFGVILLGASVANLHAGWACRGFPFCEGAGLGPPAGTLGAIHWIHRIAAYLFLVALATGSIWLARRGGRALRLGAGLTLGATICQVGVGAAMVLHSLPVELRAAHLLFGTLVWVGLVLMLLGAREGDAAPAPGEPEPLARLPGGPAPARQTAPAATASTPSLLRDLVTLTKPRIISLLLVTTVAPMFITGEGVPSPLLVLWVIVGGYLMAGGANAVNMWFDRDIDTRMSRTRLRPVPAGRLAPGAALAFGLGLAAVAFFVFYRLVNPLAAWLALGGFVFYTIVYTMLLKRTTTQNIVVGGAAGAFPPLVGWAAMTGRVDLAAIYLFAIIFYWTPPHFWALALIKQGEYARAGVPMMPVVRGERRTKVEMLLYTLFLLPLTILPAFFGALGPFYLVAAVLLGARLLWYCIRLLREEGVTPTAWKLYKYSLLYLALLFVAMGVDRVLPFGTLPLGHGPAPRAADVIILTHPDSPAIPARATSR